MPQNESHDQNFKNLFLDFPQEALEWVLPQATQTWGAVQHVEFVRQEPRKRTLSDPHLVLDMPILFSFQDGRRLLLWLVEFQEDKAKFSIHKLARYTIDMMEAHPNATVVPTVLFTDRVRWRKDVARQLKSEFQSRAFVQFEYVFLKLFDLHAKDYYHLRNPVVSILLPKMNYAPEDRGTVIWQAYWGLYQLVSLPVFEKYMDFIDVYAEVNAEEREQLLHELQHKEEFAMIRQYILEEGRQEGVQQGQLRLLSRLLVKKFHLTVDDVTESLRGLRLEDLSDLGEYLLDCDSVNDIREWIHRRRQGNLS